MSEPLRVLHVHDRLSVRGGADLHLIAVLDRLPEGVRADLAVGRREHPPPEPWPFGLHRIRELGGRAREGARAARDLARLVEALAPHVVHLHDVTQPEVAETLAPMAPLVATVQDHRAFCPGRGRVRPDGRLCAVPPGPEACASCFEDPVYASWIVARTRRRLDALRRARRVVVLSRYMAQELAAAGLEPTRIRVIPPFVWRGPAPAPPAVGEGYPWGSGPCFLAAGRLTWAKGFQVLLQAHARARTTLPLLVAGDGPLRGDLEARAARDALRVHFPGWLPHGALLDLLPRARAFVLPSVWAEPFGIAGLEALAAGVPVIASDVGGVSEWLDPAAGWLVPSGDAAALAEALEAASDPDEAGRRGAVGAAHVAARFRAPDLMAALEAVWREAAGG
ncbi:MAG: glycosyltransferase family 4 protein [Deltaproteobacteria bacterium]|nr:glycosyltransferase family 4 protein [Deltaproteobacteria bacterium]